jgi:hypothetical protein
MWYYYNDIKDQEEDYIKERNLTEYLASFIEPEMVSKIVEQREKNKENVIGTTDDEAFSKSIGQIFGRDPKLSPEAKGDGEVHKVSNLLERIETYEKEQAALRKENMPYNYKHWSDFDLG